MLILFSVKWIYTEWCALRAVSDARKLHLLNWPNTHGVAECFMRALCHLSSTTHRNRPLTYYSLRQTEVHLPFWLSGMMQHTRMVNYACTFDVHTWRASHINRLRSLHMNTFVVRTPRAHAKQIGSKRRLPFPIQSNPIQSSQWTRSRRRTSRRRIEMQTKWLRKHTITDGKHMLRITNCTRQLSRVELRPISDEKKLCIYVRIVLIGGVGYI